jgi:hypothetical protein
MTEIFSCKHCNYQTKYIGNYNKHCSTQKHNNKSNTDIQFNEKYINFDAFKIQTPHFPPPPPPPPHFCVYCGNKYSRKDSLKRHQNVCSNNKSLQNSKKINNFSASNMDIHHILKQGKNTNKKKQGNSMQKVLKKSRLNSVQYKKFNKLLCCGGGSIVNAPLKNIKSISDNQNKKKQYKKNNNNSISIDNIDNIDNCYDVDDVDDVDDDVDGVDDDDDDDVDDGDDGYDVDDGDDGDDDDCDDDDDCHDCHDDCDNNDVDVDDIDIDNNAINIKDDTKLFKFFVEQYKNEIINKNDIISSKEQLLKHYEQELKYMRKIIEKERDGGTHTHIVNKYENAPPLEKPKLSDVLKLTNFIGKVKNKKEGELLIIKQIFSAYNHGTIGQYIGNIIISIYKKKDPELQSMWATDTSRLTYLIKKQQEDKNSIWIVDKKGVETIKYVIDPIIEKIKTLSKMYLDDNPPNKHNGDTIMSIERTYVELINDIDDRKIHQKVLKYITSHFYFDKNKK